MILNFLFFQGLSYFGYTWTGAVWIITSVIIIFVACLAAGGDEPDYENNPWYQLNTRARNALTKHGCHPSLEGVMCYTKDDLLNVPGLGKKSFIELENWLNHHNVVFDE